jgi:TolB-like protein/predicted Ser/Thr protein kinase
MIESLAHYKILGPIGAGGMGEVYRARDTRLGRTVAIKVLADEVANDPERRERLLQEARATAALSHPNIAALYEIGEDQGHQFLAFEYVPGETLKSVIAGRPLNPRRAIDLAVQLADALAEAHAEGVVHRDIKPENIIVTPKGHAKILDFGLATWTTSGAEREQAATMIATGAGTALGTVAYMSPEQALGQPVDHRTDIFSLGIVMFEMLTGRLPFIGPTSTAVALQIVQASAPLPSSVNPEVPRELDAIVAKALAKSLDQRYETAASLAAELRSVGAILDVRSGDIEPASAMADRAAPRRSYAWIVWLIVLAALLAAAWFERAAIARLWSRTLGPAPPPVIAVIPLEIAGAQTPDTYFADGLTEDLITRLGQTPGLKVLGRSATRQYRGRSPREVARELGAGVVLTGSVRPLMDNVKVSLELVDPSEGTAIWSNQYTRELKDIFAVQAQVADEVAQALRVALQPTPSRARARSRLVDRRAYELYLRGRQAIAERRLADAIGLFEEAIAADAGLAEAFAGLAEALSLETAFAPPDPARAGHVRDAAERAYQLDPDLPQANLALGLTADTLAASLDRLRHAIELDPSLAEGFHQIGDQIVDFDPNRAVDFYRLAVALDPKAIIVRIDVAIAELLRGRIGDARRALPPPEEGPPRIGGLSRAFGLLVDVYDDRVAEALSSLATNPAVREAPFQWLFYVQALRGSGRTTDAYREASQLATKFPPYCEGKAALAGLTAERGQAAAARAMAAPILQAAQLRSADGPAVRCGVFAAAALNDASAAADLLRSIAANEPLLRYWALAVTGQTGSLALQGRLYPWTNVMQHPAVVEARQTLDAAYTRERDIARTVLAGLP